MSDIIHLDDHNAPPALPRGRLIFALDATASRGETWALARERQADMFRKAAPIGRLEVKLVAYGGDWCRKSPWKSSGEEITRIMNTITCDGGCTQIGRVPPASFPIARRLLPAGPPPVRARYGLGRLGC
jgi:hypothetical protein